MADQPPSQPPPPTQPPPPSQPPPPQPGMPPPAAGYTPPAGPSGPRSGFWRRVGAAIIDGILVSIPVSILGALFGIGPFSDTTGAGSTAYQALATVVGWAYGTYFEGSGAGQTVGKKVLNIRVIDFATGGPLGYPKAFVRQLVKLVSGLACGLGYLWMLWDREKQTWHDKVATTVVVPTDAYPVSSWPG
jgi:uncharacterized RDD family membrane protein YckC